MSLNQFLHQTAIRYRPEQLHSRPYLHCEELQHKLVQLSACGRKPSEEVCAVMHLCRQQRADCSGSLCWEGTGVIWRDAKLRGFPGGHHKYIWCLHLSLSAADEFSLLLREDVIPSHLYKCAYTKRFNK